jgi:hypothetical protein
MKPHFLPWLMALVATCLPVHGVDLKERSVSGSKQFIIFSSDVRVRQRVASYADDLKADFLRLLGEEDHWKMPIVVTLARASTENAGELPADVRLVATPAGSKIEIDVRIGDDPAAVNLQKHFLRALLLEYAYRGVTVKGGGEVVEAPWWVLEGLIEMERRREAGVDSDLFRRLVETNHLPPIESFLLEKPEALGPTALAVDRALSMCLLQMLVEQPGGHAALDHLVRDWPQSNGYIMALLAREFPAVAGNTQTLQKWWTVNLGRYAASDRYKGMTTDATDKALGQTLQIEFVTNKAGDKRTYAVGDYQEFMKLPGSRATLAARHREILDLSTRANALLEPVVSDYEQIFSLLSRGKTHGLRDRIARAEQYRAFALHRISDIGDYLNWFEATQSKSSSGTFDNYLKTANEISEEDRKAKGPIGRYLDELEQEF